MSATDRAAKRPMAEDDLLKLMWVADPQIAPDGTRVAFTRVHVDAEADEYRSAIWVADVPQGHARPLTFGAKDRQPRWSPDGRWLAFVRTPEGEKDGQLWLLPMGGGEARVLAALAGGIGSPAWSPDGTRIAFTSAHHPGLDDPKRAKPRNEPARVVTRPVFRENNVGFTDLDHLEHVWVVDVAGGAPRALTRGRFVEGAPGWSPDGAKVRFVSDRRSEPWFGGEESVLYAVDAGRAEPTDGEALEIVLDTRAGIRDWTADPDGRLALIAVDVPPAPRSYDQATLLVAGGPGGPPRDLAAAADVAVGETVNSDQHPPRGGGATPLAFAEGGRAVIARVCTRGASYLARFDTGGGAMTLLTPSGRDVVAGTASRDGRHWALTVGSFATPGDLCHFDAATSALTTLYAPNDALLAQIALGEVEEFWCDAFDGERLHAWLVKPPGFDPARRHPLVLEIHGGPHTAYGHGFFHEFHHLAGAGYLVLVPNPRGSTGYGREFANVIQYKYPGDDYLDLMTCVDEAVRRGGVDERRMGVTGGSGGGLLTNWIITQTRRFAAAVTQRCVADWASMWYSSDFALFTPSWFRRPPFEDPVEYAERSPATYASRIETPLMVIHSEEDWRTPIHEGEVMFRALHHRRKPAVMVRFPGENHELSRSGAPSRRVQNQHHIRAWFDRWLQDKPAPEYDA